MALKKSYSNSRDRIRYRYRNHMSIEDMLTNKEKCTVKYVTYDNKTLSVKQWSDMVGISRDVLYHRLKRYDFDMGRVFDNFDDMNYNKCGQHRGK